MIRHNRILDLRSKISKGWNLEQMLSFCINKLQVSKQTANSYIDEAAEPYRKKYLKENKIES